MTSERAVRIGDVARRAGVSVGTVSNVLNRPHIVSEATQRIVHEAIDDLGFIPNASARQLRQGASRAAGVLVLDIANPFFMEMARGIEDRLSQDGFTMVLSSSDSDPDRERRALEQFAQQRLRGVLLTPTRRTVDNLQLLTSQGTRVVFLDHKPRGQAFDAVVADDVAGARAALEHLLGLDHHDIGFLNGPLDLQQCRERRAGARRAIRASRGTARLVELEVRDLNAAGGEAGMAQLLTRHPEVTATFCVNDLVALGAMRYAREHGIQVPQQMSIVGYDDVPFAGELAVPLTSVRQPTYQMGWQAADLMLSSRPPQQVVFQPEFIARASTSRSMGRRSA